MQPTVNGADDAHPGRCVRICVRQEGVAPSALRKAGGLGFTPFPQILMLNPLVGYGGTLWRGVHLSARGVCVHWCVFAPGGIGKRLDFVQCGKKTC